MEKCDASKRNKSAEVKDAMQRKDSTRVLLDTEESMHNLEETIPRKKKAKRKAESILPK